MQKPVPTATSPVEELHAEPERDDTVEDAGSAEQENNSEPVTEPSDEGSATCMEVKPMNETLRTAYV